ncbi:MAG TPA: hypothetical protein VMX36_15345 [Sedimentisphaerales bacterium]|nr:hypothetical protein [Sedimentisphaerales bacterium]
MNSEQPNRVSVIDPVTPAIDRVKLILFRPFDLRKWFVIGFCAWLAYLGGGGGGGGGGGSGHPYNVPHKQNEAREQIRQGVETARNYVSNNLYWIIPATVTVVVLIILIGLLVVWLNSRGKFMFLHCVATNKAQVAVPWHKFRQQGNSLFLFRIVLGIISLVVVVVPVIGIVALVIMMISGTAPGIVSIPGIVILGLTIFALLILLFLVKKFTFDFVVPIMSLRMSSCMAGWREFMTILSANKLRFTLYLLFQIVIKIVIGAIVGIGFCIGCCFCCASCLLLVPYIGTVILLPVLVFTRAYSLCYLQQYGPQFDVFRTEIEAVESV